MLHTKHLESPNMMGEIPVHTMYKNPNVDSAKFDMEGEREQLVKETGLCKKHKCLFSQHFIPHLCVFSHKSAGLISETFRKERIKYAIPQMCSSNILTNNLLIPNTTQQLQDKQFPTPILRPQCLFQVPIPK